MAGYSVRKLNALAMARLHVAACIVLSPVFAGAAANTDTQLIIRHFPDATMLSQTKDSPPLEDCDRAALSCDGPAVAGSRPDHDGLRRDTWYFVGVQFATIGILYVMPESVSSWSDEEKDDYSLGKWWDNVRHPKRDTDDHFINYVLHPYCGAAYYVRAPFRMPDVVQRL